MLIRTTHMSDKWQYHEPLKVYLEQQSVHLKEAGVARFDQIHPADLRELFDALDSEDNVDFQLARSARTAIMQNRGKMLDSLFCSCGGQFDHVDWIENDDNTFTDSLFCDRCETFCHITWDDNGEISREYEREGNDEN